MPKLQTSLKAGKTIGQLAVVAFAVALVMTAVIQTQSSRASRADGVDGGVGSSQQPCPIIVGTTASGQTVYESGCTSRPTSSPGLTTSTSINRNRRLPCGQTVVTSTRYQLGC